MSILISIIIALVIVGIVLYLVNILPIQQSFKQIIDVLIIICLLLWFLSLFGVLQV